MKTVNPDYRNSILNVTCSILRYYNAPTSHPSLVALDQWLAANQPSHIIYVLLDGLGMNVIDEHLNEKSALRKHLLQPVTSVYPPTTVAATTSVISGLSPLESGHIGWVQYFPEEDTNLVVFQNLDFYTKEPQTDNLKDKYLSFPTFYEQINRSNPNIVTKEFFPSFRAGGSESFDEEIERVLLSTHNTDQSFNYVYWIEPDLKEHEYGTSSPEVKQTVQSLNQSVQQLIDHVPSDTAVILIADHGLVDVETIPLKDYEDITSLLRQPPCVEPRTTSFFVHAGSETLFKERFQKHFGGWFKLYTKHEFLNCGLLGSGNPHPMLEHTLGDFISVAVDSYMFGYHEGKSYKAHHAGLSEAEMMVPLIVYAKK